MSGQLATTAVLSGLFAAVVAVAVTRAIERLGGLFGGVLGTSPTTIVPTAIGLSLRLSGCKLVESMVTVSVGMLVNAAFLATWRFLPPRLPTWLSVRARLLMMMAASYGVWLALAAGAVAFQLNALQGRTTAVVTFCLVCYVCVLALGTRLCLHPLPAPGGSKLVPLTQLLARGVLAGVSITVAVLLSTVDGIVAGMASTFPAIFSTTMISLWLAQGEACSIGAVGPMVLGSSSVPTFAFIFAGLMTSETLLLGPYASAAVAYILAVSLTSVPIAVFLRWRRGLTDAAGAHGGGLGGGASGSTARVDEGQATSLATANAEGSIDDSAVITLEPPGGAVSGDGDALRRHMYGS